MRIFWPVFLGFALVSIVVMWIAAPSFRNHVPENMRSSWAHGIATINGVDLAQMERQQAERRDALIEAERDREEAARAAALTPKPSEMSVRSRPRAVATRKTELVAARTVPVNQAVEAPSAETQPPAAEAQYDPIPSTLGIMQTDYKEASWGIVNAITPYKSLSDGEVLGNAGIGTVFLVEQRQPADGGGAEFVGNFRNHRLDEPVVISAANIYCFKGSYDSLTQRQKAALTSYYKARAEVERIKREISKENGSKSPFFAKAVAAKTKWDEMVKTTEALEVALRTDKKANASQIRDKLARMKGEMAVQKNRLKDLSDKHKAWKEKNAPNLPDPEDDPRIKKLRDEMQGYAKPIPGLAF